MYPCNIYFLSVLISEPLLPGMCCTVGNVLPHLNNKAKVILCVTSVYRENKNHAITTTPLE